MPSSIRPGLIGFCLACLLAWAVPPAHATPQPVVVGTYVNKIQALDFKGNRYTLDMFIWFRWQATGALQAFRPLESVELVNGFVESRSSVVEKTVGDTHYASMRVVATVVENWQLAKFPFDRHTLEVLVEESDFSLRDLVFVVDEANTRLGDELDLAGWRAAGFHAGVGSKVYHSNYGDPALPSDAFSEFSRYGLKIDIERQTFGSALKLLSTVLLSAAVAFVAFLVKPSDLDARFGMGVGALFAVAASAFVASSSVPDSGVMTTADRLHMAALGVIFVSLLVSAVCLKLEGAGRQDWVRRVDRGALALLPLAFYGWAAWEIWRSTR